MPGRAGASLDEVFQQLKAVLTATRHPNVFPAVEGYFWTLSVATENVGNQESAPGTTQAVTQVLVNRAPTLGSIGNRTVKLVRRAVYVPSVGWELIRLDDGSPTGIAAGLLRIHHFQDTTPHEAKEALGQMTNLMGQGKSNWRRILSVFAQDDCEAAAIAYDHRVH